MQKKPESLFVAADIHGLNGESRLGEVLARVREDKTAVQPELVLLGGDYVGQGRPPSTEEERLRRWQPVFSLSELHDDICSALGKEVKTFFTYGSHDKNALTGEKSFLCGSADCGAYAIYGISFAQMRFAAESQMLESGYDGADTSLGCAEQAVESFLRWETKQEGKKPLFVMSHLPLHVHRGDNRGAALWCKALSRAGTHRDVLVFFAHNHTTERKTDYDKAFYLVPKGERLPVQGAEKEQTEEKDIAFTYLNAGYVLHGCGTLLTFSDENADGVYDRLQIRRYGPTEKETAFGSTGFTSPYELKGEWI